MELQNEDCGDNANDYINPINRVFNIREMHEYIFSFLPLSTIKTCRLVNHNWNETAEIFLLKSSRISFYRKPGGSRLPDKFIDDFRNSSLRNKFDKFCFKSPYLSIDFESTLSNFVRNFGSMMKELTITDLQHRPVTNSMGMNDPDDRVKDITKLIPFNLTKLHIFCKGKISTSIISMNRLRDIRILRLEGAKLVVEISKNFKISPVKLQLKNFKINKRSNFTSFYGPREQCVNEIFDFSKLQMFELDCSNRNMSLQPQTVEMGRLVITIDMSGVVNLKSLNLVCVKIINWEESKWTVKKLTLGRQMKFITSTGIKFNELDFSGTMIDLALLPTTIKSLTLRDFTTKLLNIEFAQKFVDLQKLTLCRGEFILFTHFRNCVQLTHLHLDGDIINIDVSVIPKSLKFLRLTFHGFDCNLSGTANFHLETLIIENTGFLRSFQIAISVLKTKNVFLDCSDFDFVTMENVTKKFMEEQFRNYMVGPFFQEKRDKLAFHSLKDRKVDYLIKKTEDTNVTAKEFAKTELERIKNAWWTKALQ